MVRGKVTAVTEFIFTGLKKGATGITSVGSAAVKTASKTKIFQRGLDGVGSALVRVGRLAAKTNLDRFGRGLSRTIGFTRNLALVTAGLATASVLAGRSFLELFSRSQQIERGFKTTAKVLGVDWKNALDVANKATRGTISQMELMRIAGTFLRQVSKDVDVMGSSFDKAFDIAKAKGEDVNFIIESITQGIAKQQPLILDNLGVIVKQGDAQKKFAESIGKTVSQLSGQEKRLAFNQAALLGLEDAQKKVGRAAEDSSDRLARQAIKWEELKIRMGGVLAESPAVEEFMAQISKGLENAAIWFSANSEEIKLWIRDMIDAGKVAFDLAGKIGGLVVQFSALDKSFAAIQARRDAIETAGAALKEAEKPIITPTAERGRIIEQVTQRGIEGLTGEELRKARTTLISRIRDQIITLQGAQQVADPQAQPGGLERILGSFQRAGLGTQLIAGKLVSDIVTSPIHERRRLERFDPEGRVQIAERTKEASEAQIRALNELLETVEQGLRDMNESLIENVKDLKSNIDQLKTERDVELVEDGNKER